MNNIKLLSTVYPSDPPKDFNAWIIHIHNLLNNINTQN
jgi:hypothetical protein